MPDTGIGERGYLPADIKFRHIDFKVDIETVLYFARDLFSISFNDSEWFDCRFGITGREYIVWLLAHTGGIESFSSFALIEGEPVGMVVLGREPGQVGTGHIYHYYLCPTARGQGLGVALDEHAAAVLKAEGLWKANLHVAPNNTAAITFYKKRGWLTVGELPDKGVAVMVKSLSDKDT